MNKNLHRTAVGGGGYRPISAILILSFIFLATIGAFALVGPDDCAEVSGESNTTTGGDCGTNLHWTLDDDGKLTITGYGEMSDYTGTAPWGTGVKTVIFNIKEGQTATIGKNAFASCNSLTSINIPNSVTSIGAYAFNNCSTLGSVNFGNGSLLGSIGEYAFYKCTGLTSIKIPNKVDNIGNAAFANCTGLNSVTFVGSSLTSIEDNTFYNCTSLTSIDIPDSVESIKDVAFSRCESLKIIRFGTGINSIDEKAFSWWDKENWSTKATIFSDENDEPLNLTDIDEFKGRVFTGTIKTMCRAPDTVEDNGIIYKISDSNLNEAYVYGYTDKINSDSTIRDYISIKDVSFKVTSIGERAFAECETLESVTIPSTVESIDDEAFYGCTRLNSVTIPDSVTSIGECAFKECDALPSVTIPKSVTSIGMQAFAECRSLKSIEVDSGNNNYCSVDGVLFTNDKKTLIQYPPSKEGSAYSIPGSVETIGKEAFGMCENLVSIEMPESLTCISAEAFVVCRSLASVYIPSKVTTIPSGAFYDCTSLTSITITDTVTTIEEYAFASCIGLKTIYFSNGLTSVDPTAFGILVEEEFTATKFCDSNGNEISLSDIEKFKGKAFTGDISEMKMMTDMHTVTIFDGTTYRTYTGCVGDEIPQPADPTRDGYVFLYWADEDGNEFDWIIPAKDITVTAQWKAVSPSGDDDDDDYYPSHDASDDPDSMNKKSDNSTKVLIIAACVAAFMALLLAFTTYETKR